MSTKPAVFLDRDGTLIHDPGYLADPAGVRLLPGAADAVRRLNEAGWLAVVVTNQSGIARGLLTEDQYHAVARAVADAFEASGAHLDAQYHCPHLPALSGPCECRKPGTLLYRRAATDLALDLGRSWLVGDRLRDVAAAEALGARGGILLGNVEEPGWSGRRAAAVEEAVAHVLRAPRGDA